MNILEPPNLFSAFDGSVDEETKEQSIRMLNRRTLLARRSESFVQDTFKEQVFSIPVIMNNWALRCVLSRSVKRLFERKTKRSTSKRRLDEWSSRLTPRLMDDRRTSRTSDFSSPVVFVRCLALCDIPRSWQAIGTSLCTFTLSPLSPCYSPPSLRSNSPLGRRTNTIQHSPQWTIDLHASSEERISRGRRNRIHFPWTWKSLCRFRRGKGSFFLSLSWWMKAGEIPPWSSHWTNSLVQRNVQAKRVDRIEEELLFEPMELVFQGFVAIELFVRRQCPEEWIQFLFNERGYCSYRGRSSKSTIFFLVVWPIFRQEFSLPHRRSSSLDVGQTKILNAWRIERRCHLDDRKKHSFVHSNLPTPIPCLDRIQWIEKNTILALHRRWQNWYVGWG